MTINKPSYVLITLLFTTGAVVAAEPAVQTNAVSASSSEAVGACVDLSTSCLQSVKRSTPSWQQELQRAQAAGDACEEDVNRFCEGIQVGGGRIVKCLKAHRRQLSDPCKATLRLR